MGDDLIDLPSLTRCGLAIAPANAANRQTKRSCCQKWLAAKVLVREAIN